MFLRFTHLLRSFIVCFCCAFLLTITIAPLAYAHTTSDPITITAESDSIHFPNSIDFQVSAIDTAHPITEAIIDITYNGTPDSFPTQHVIRFSHSSHSISTRWSEDTSTNSSFQLPGTPVQYYWVIQDSSGFQHTQAEQSFTVIDTRYAWQHLSSGLLQVDWYNRSTGFGQLLLQDAQNALSHIQGNLGGGLLHPVNLWVYASDQDFHGALGPGAYEWVGGEAIPWLKEAFISVLDSNDTTLIRDMPHELTHLVFHQLIVQGQAVPTWFDEGLAVYNQFYHEPDMLARFNQALSAHSLLLFSNISLGFPSDADQAYLAYAESWQFLSYLYKTFGTSKMQRLISNMNNPSLDFDSDLQQTLGADTIHLENQWLLSLNQPGILSPDQITPTPRIAPTTAVHVASATDGTIPVLTVFGALLILLPLAGIVVILVHQFRKRSKAAAVSPSTAYSAPVNVPNRPAAQTPNASRQYQYVPFYYPASDEALNARRILPNASPNQPPPPAPSMPVYQNGAPSPAAPQNQQQGRDEMLSAWGPFSEYSDTVEYSESAKRAPGKQVPQE